MRLGTNKAGQSVVVFPDGSEAVLAHQVVDISLKTPVALEMGLFVLEVPVALAMYKTAMDHWERIAADRLVEIADLKEQLNKR